MIDNEINKCIDLSFGDALSISKHIWYEKYQWLPKNFDMSMLEIDDYTTENENVLGFIRVGKCGYTKMYFLKCDKCSENSSLHGLGVFANNRSNIQKGIISCDCSKTSKLTKYQYILKILEKCKELKYEFIGFGDDWECTKSKGLVHLILSCTRHGIWKTTTVDNLLFHSKGCKLCGNERISSNMLVDDEYHIKEIQDTKRFHPDAKFWRSSRLNSYGYQNYWFYQCPVCNTVSESQIGNLKEGKVSCLCNGNIQQQCYINLVLDNDTPIALKYGQATEYSRRVKSQNKKSIYDVENCGVWEFESVLCCKSAEAECKRTFNPVLEYREMNDGYTETTSTMNIEKIIDIFESWGGVRIK